MSDLRHAVEAAFDFRGDVTLHLKDGSTVVGYVFDRRLDSDEPTVHCYPADGSPVELPIAQVERIEHSGRDMATGRSWEEWVKKWDAAKAEGRDMDEIAPKPTHLDDGESD